MTCIVLEERIRLRMQFENKNIRLIKVFLKKEINQCKQLKQKDFLLDKFTQKTDG